MSTFSVRRTKDEARRAASTPGKSAQSTSTKNYKNYKSAQRLKKLVDERRATGTRIVGAAIDGRHAGVTTKQEAS